MARIFRSICLASLPPVGSVVGTLVVFHQVKRIAAFQVSRQEHEQLTSSRSWVCVWIIVLSVNTNPETRIPVVRSIKF